MVARPGGDVYNLLRWLDVVMTMTVLCVSGSVSRDAARAYLVSLQVAPTLNWWRSSSSSNVTIGKINCYAANPDVFLVVFFLLVASRWLQTWRQSIAGSRVATHYATMIFLTILLPIIIITRTQRA